MTLPAATMKNVGKKENLMRNPLSHRGVSFRSALMTGLLMFVAPTLGAQTVTQIIDAGGDGDVTHPLDYPAGIAVDAAGNVCVGGRDSNNAFRITAGGVIDAGNHIQKSRFTIARLTDDGHKISSRNAEVHFIQDRYFVIPDGINFDDVLELND